MNTRTIFGALVVIATVALGALAYTTVGPPPAAAGVTTIATVQPSTVLSSVTASGNVDAPTQVSLSFPTSRSAPSAL